MSRSQEQVDNIRDDIRQVLQTGKVNRWEKDFLQSMDRKFVRYGRKTLLSDKQWATLMKLCRPARQSTREEMPGPWQAASSSGGRSRSEGDWPRQTAEIYQFESVIPRNYRRSGWTTRKALRYAAIGVVLLVTAAASTILPTPSRNISGLVIGNGQANAPPANPQGRASVIDGDTIGIHGQRIRIADIDAPESGQFCYDKEARPLRCGAMSANFLKDFLEQSSPTRCEFREWDRYGRMVADCFRADGGSVGTTMVRKGWALDFVRYSNGRYSGEESQARNNQNGIWQYRFEKPWNYRSGETTSSRKDDSAPPNGLVGNSVDRGASSCEIKGNISPNTGEKIYHVPGQEFYGRTRIDRQKGERMFCSEAEARKAGWRKARN